MSDHTHEWEHGAHMAEAFGIDGRRSACAICGKLKPPVTAADLRGLAQNLLIAHDGGWPAEEYIAAWDALRAALATEAEAASQPPSGDALREALNRVRQEVYETLNDYEVDAKAGRAILDRFDEAAALATPAPLDGPTVPWVGNPLAEEPRGTPAPLEVEDASADS